MDSTNFTNPPALGDYDQMKKDIEILKIRLDSHISKVDKDEMSLLKQIDALPYTYHNLATKQIDESESKEWDDIYDVSIDQASLAKMDSTIINKGLFKEHIKVWLASVKRNSEPTLVYRASRDGWEARDFHKQSDGIGATITLVKSSEGYIFGAYTDVSWTAPLSAFGNYKPSNEAFLFSLKCKAGLAPTKMDIKTEKTKYASRHYAEYGPSFGDGYDLMIGSNASGNGNANASIGHTYHLPKGITDPHFLTGSHKFDVTEYEVFQV